MGFFSSKKKKVNQATKLICASGNSGSYKCLFLSSYRKLPIEVSWVDSSVADDKLSESLHMTGLNRFPCIEDGDFTVCGTNAVMTYLNIKGNAPSIHPRKARVLAAQNYWVQVLVENFEPLLNDISSNTDHIANILDVLNQELGENKHIVSEFSLADIHWAAIFKILDEQGQNSLYSNFENINTWLANIKNEIPAFEASADSEAA
jgi:glutathione S-transferase